MKREHLIAISMSMIFFIVATSFSITTVFGAFTEIGSTLFGGNIPERGPAYVGGSFYGSGIRTPDVGMVRLPDRVEVNVNGQLISVNKMVGPGIGQVDTVVTDPTTGRSIQVVVTYIVDAVGINTARFSFGTWVDSGKQQPPPPSQPTPPPVTTTARSNEEFVTCYSNANCNDGNSATTDACINPGTYYSTCSYSPVAPASTPATPIPAPTQPTPPPSSGGCNPQKAVVKNVMPSSIVIVDPAVIFTISADVENDCGDRLVGGNVFYKIVSGSTDCNLETYTEKLSYIGYGVWQKSATAPATTGTYKVCVKAENVPVLPNSPLFGAEGWDWSAQVRTTGAEKSLVSDGNYADISLTDAWAGQDERGRYTWDFGKIYDGTFVVKWFGKVGGDYGYGTWLTFTIIASNDGSSWTKIREEILASPSSTTPLYTDRITGKYRYVRAEIYSSVGKMCQNCHLYVDYVGIP